MVVKLGACIEESITNDWPNIEDAALNQISFEWERRTSLGRHGTTSGAGQTTYSGEYKLLDSVRKQMSQYVVHHLRV